MLYTHTREKERREKKIYITTTVTTAALLKNISPKFHQLVVSRNYFLCCMCLLSTLKYTYVQFTHTGIKRTHTHACPLE